MGEGHQLGGRNAGEAQPQVESLLCVAQAMMSYPDCLKTRFKEGLAARWCLISSGSFQLSPMN